MVENARKLVEEKGVIRFLRLLQTLSPSTIIVPGFHKFVKA